VKQISTYITVKQAFNSQQYSNVKAHNSHSNKTILKYKYFSMQKLGPLRLSLYEAFSEKRQVWRRASTCTRKMKCAWLLKLKKKKLEIFKSLLKMLEEKIQLDHLPKRKKVYTCSWLWYCVFVWIRLTFKMTFQSEYIQPAKHLIIKHYVYLKAQKSFIDIILTLCSMCTENWRSLYVHEFNNCYIA
jgi:hypothetical protein